MASVAKNMLQHIAKLLRNNGIAIDRKEFTAEYLGPEMEE